MSAQMEAGAAALPKPLGAYPRFKRAGDMVYVSGLSARLPDGSIAGVSDEAGVRHRDVRVQTHRVMKNLIEVLRAAGAGLQDCVDITVFLTERVDFDACNRAYGEYFSGDAPARTTVIVRGLPHPDMVVEVKAVAWAPARS